MQYNINQSMEGDESSRPAQYSAENIFYDQLPFRIEGQRLQELAHRSVVALTFLNVHKKIGAGSGVLISKDTILTVAHNIYLRHLRAKNTNFKVYIGANGVGEDYYQVEGWRYPQQFETCPASAQLEFDYAILKLKKPVDFHQFLPLFPACQKEDLMKDNQQTMLEVYGFPRAYPPDQKGITQSFMGNFEALDQFGTKIRLYQYGLARLGRIAVVDASQLKLGYGVSTLPGQSGSPVMIGNTIIAVHVGGENGKAFNVGRIVDETLLKNISEWGKQLNAASFSLDEPHKSKQNQPNSQSLQKQGHLQKSKDQLLKSTVSETKPVASTKQESPKKSNGETRLYKMKNNLKRMDLQQYSDLIDLQLWDVNLEQIDLSPCPRLTVVKLNNNKLKKIDLSHCPLLTKLYLIDNQLQQINLSNCPQLTELALNNNRLQKIDLTNNKHLSILVMVSNQLQEIDLSANTELAQLYLSSNRIVKIDLAKNTKLQWLQLQKNRLEIVLLCIVDNVKEETYIDYFRFNDQQSAACRVQLTNEVHIKQKAASIAKKWKSKYKAPFLPIFINIFNMHRCSYSFKLA